MNVLRKERDDEDDNLTTADLVGRNRDDAPTPRQAYAAGLEPAHTDNARINPGDARAADLRKNPPDYTPPPNSPTGDADQPRRPQPVPSAIPPAAPVAAVPAPAPAANPAPPARGPVPVPAGATAPDSPGPLFPEDELHNFRARWDQVQTSFVDEPRKAVEGADSLVANVVKRIAEQFANERENLEKQWDRGDSVNTEDLRQALKRYRAFFDRLLSF